MVRSLFLIGLWLTLGFFPVSAQQLYDARSMAMGATGVATSSGTAALRHNPANLMIFERPQRWIIAVGSGGFQNSRGLTLDHTDNPAVYLYGFDRRQSRTDYPSTGSSENLLNQWFNTTSLQTYQAQKTDLLVAAVTYTGQNFGVGFSHSIRGENSYKIGRGWYDENDIQLDNLLVGKRTLQHKQHLRHEFGIALAWEYDLISGWLSDLSRIYIGVNPKLILPVTYSENTLHSRFGRPISGSTNISHLGSFTGKSAGRVSDFYRSEIERLQSNNPNSAYFNPSDLTSFAGIGGGFDAGITYIVGLDNDITLTTRNRIPTKYSLRLSASINDIGFVTYNRNPLRVESTERGQTFSDETQYRSIATTEYLGNLTEFYDFAVQGPIEKNLISSAREVSTDPIRMLLPSRVNVGFGLQLNRFVLSGEIQNPLNSWTIEPEKRSYHIGAEIRLIRTIPIRTGFIFQGGEPIIYTAGLGLDFRVITFSAGTAMRTNSGVYSFVPNSTSFTALQIRF